MVGALATLLAGLAMLMAPLPCVSQFCSQADIDTSPIEQAHFLPDFGRQDPFLSYVQSPNQIFVRPILRGPGFGRFLFPHLIQSPHAPARLLVSSTMDSKRDLASLTAPAQQMRVCSGCSVVQFSARSTSPKPNRTCLFYHPPCLAQIRVRAVSEIDLREGVEVPVREIVTVLIEHKLEGGDSESESKCAYVKVGIVKIDLVDVRRARACGFRECMEKLSADLSNLAAHFDPYTGGVLPGRRCYLEDFSTERHIAYIDEFLIETPWRGSGLDLWLLSNLFHFESLRGVRFMFARPDVLQNTDDGLRYTPPPRGRAAEELLVQVGFRCVGDSQLFCMGKRRSDMVII
ncbi:hypothetical protein DFH08DRAFT_934040 [Mycena albidolilacea]|uniref:Uncharacterized protein n=1 Tax=Mycena albidolilacea TaxID=1033008 RepID=A0AAD7EVT2_9AGAR|nr:hypothetical protein DFH08DRAFT_934040 [Mycena albidolilacea]